MSARLTVIAAIGLAAIAASFTTPAPAARAASASGNTPAAAPDTPRTGHVLHLPRRPARRVATHRLRHGEYLSEVAVRACGRADDWLGIWHATKPHIPDPNVVPAGLVVTIACNHDGPGYPAARHSYPARRSSSGGKIWGVSYGYPYQCGDDDRDGYDIPCSRLHRSSSGYRASSSGGYARASYGAAGSFEACVIARESGGNAQVMNSSSHYGLYQFSSSTWKAYGGNPADFGHASAAEQRRVFLSAIAQGGQSNWSPYDGCSL